MPEYKDDPNDFCESYDGSYDEEIKRNPDELLKIGDITFYNVAAIRIELDYYWVNHHALSASELDLTLECVTLLDKDEYEIAHITKLSDKEIIELGFPYEECLTHAQREGEL